MPACADQVVSGSQERDVRLGSDGNGATSNVAIWMEKSNCPADSDISSGGERPTEGLNRSREMQMNGINKKESSRNRQALLMIANDFSEEEEEESTSEPVASPLSHLFTSTRVNLKQRRTICSSPDSSQRLCVRDLLLLLGLVLYAFILFCALYFVMY
eukprot:Nk52_evm12s1485 gene=Nk52_evmTU12s1485